jgi:hypothetical protein
VIPFAAVHLCLLARRIDDYGGRSPFPGIWGLLGGDLVDDGYDPSPEDSSNGLDGGDEPVGDGTEDELDAYGNPITFRHHGAYCHALLSKPYAKFCDECGRPVVRSPSLTWTESPSA